MCKTAEEIRKSDYTCITLDEYIRTRKKSVNGDKESLAYLDVLRAEAQIQDRITILQTQEDMLRKFDGVETEIGKTNGKIDVVGDKLDKHLEECRREPTIANLKKNHPIKFWSSITIFALIYFVLFRLIEVWTGLGGILKALLNMIPGVDIS